MRKPTGTYGYTVKHRIYGDVGANNCHYFSVAKPIFTPSQRMLLVNLSRAHLASYTG